jgi:acyl-CoA dehydrogenase
MSTFEDVASLVKDADMVHEAVLSILAGYADQQRPVDADGREWNSDAWKALASGGFTAVSVAVGAGGSGGTIPDAVAVLEGVGRYAIAAPVAETALLAGWLLERTGRGLPEAPLTSAVSTGVRAHAGGTLTGEMSGVPWTTQAELLVLLADSDDGLVVASVDPRAAAVRPGRNLAGESRDRVIFDGTAADIAPAPPGVTHRSFELRGALTRCALIVGAAERALKITIDYTRDREQFGRPIGTFQAVQAHLVRAAEHVRMAQIATRTAGLALQDDPSDAFPDVASAKIVASDAAGAVAAMLHQATGAMGMTQEYALGHLTLRLWGWRDEYGTELDWSQRLGRHVFDAGAEQVWPAISRGADRAGVGGAHQGGVL